MKKVVRLTEEDLNRLVNRILSEQIVPTQNSPIDSIKQCFRNLDLNKLTNCNTCVNDIVAGKVPNPITAFACMGEITATLDEAKRNQVLACVKPKLIDIKL